VVQARKGGTAAAIPETIRLFGELVLGDHVVLGKESEKGLEGEKSALALFDVGTDFMDILPTKTKGAEDAEVAFREFRGTQNVKEFYSDNSKELNKMAADLGIPHPTKTPCRLIANANLDRHIRTRQDEIRCAMRQSGFGHPWWSRAARHVCVVHNCIAVEAKDGKSSFERRWGYVPDHIPMIPYGALIRFRPSKPNLEMNLRYDARTVPGLFIGWHFQPGGTFHGDFLVCALHDFRSSRSQAVHVHRIKELVLPDLYPDLEWHFPLAQAALEDELKVPDQSSLEKVLDQYPVDQWDEEDFQRELEKDVAALGPPPGLAQASEDPWSIDVEETELTAEQIYDNARAEEVRRMQLEMQSDRMPRKYAGTRRPPYVWPEVWATLGKRRQDEMVKEFDIEMCSRLGPRPGPESVVKVGSTRESLAKVAGRATESVSACEIRASGEAVGKGLPSPCVSKDEYLPTDDAPRVIIEFCCGPDSRIGRPQFVSKSCKVFRLTLEHDMTTNTGFDYAMSLVERHPGCFLWGSLPCTAGCSFFNINQVHESAWAKHEEQVETYIKLRQNFFDIGRAVLRLKGEVAWEWPANCQLWGDPHLVKFEDVCQMQRCSFNGCAFGLVSVRKETLGLPIRKRWTVSTTAPKLYSLLEKFQCPGTSVHATHATCEGQDTKMTENYTDQMVAAIHRGIRAQIMVNHDRAVALAARFHEICCDRYGDLPEVDVRQLAMIAAGVPGSSENQSDGTHRPIVPNHHYLWNAMVTKTLGPKDPQSRSPNALKAIDAELAALRDRTVWDQKAVMEAADVKRIHPDAHFARLFSIVGIK
jgi:hypothetical protein